MSDKPTLDELLEVQEFFKLPAPALVEKDWYVAKALAAIASVDAGDCRLVFGGGTALSRAYKLTKRMSEDVDIKIVSERPPTRGQLRILKRKISDALLAAGFVFDPNNPEHRVSKYRGRYTRYRLPYTAIAEGQGALRPTIQIETAVFPLRREAIDKSVSSFVAEAYGRESEVAKIACSSVLETAAEKFVALTWRAGAELAGVQKERDPTLVRHIYDLHMLRGEYDMKDVATLAHEVMLADAALRGDEFPAWKKDPLGETLKAVEGIPKDAVFVDGYTDFQRDMVYGEKPDFETAMATVQTLAEHLKKVPG